MAFAARIVAALNGTRTRWDTQEHAASATALVPSERIMTWRGLHGHPAQIREFSNARLPAEASKAAALHAAERQLGAAGLRIEDSGPIPEPDYR